MTPKTIRGVNAHFSILSGKCKKNSLRPPIKQVIGDYPTYREALSAGYERFGIQPFLVHKIEPDEDVQQFSRVI
jgi:hypothetical protein